MVPFVPGGDVTSIGRYNGAPPRDTPIYVRTPQNVSELKKDIGQTINGHVPGPNCSFILK
jgi:hypothetical protein